MLLYKMFVKVFFVNQPMAQRWLSSCDQAMIFWSVSIYMFLFVYLHVNLLNKRIKSKSKSTECQTPDCLKVAALVAKNMDTSVDACDNFYQFACGGWIKDVGVPTDNQKYDIVSELEKENGRKWKELLEGPITYVERDSAERKVKVGG